MRNTPFRRLWRRLRHFDGFRQCKGHLSVRRLWRRFQGGWRRGDSLTEVEHQRRKRQKVLTEGEQQERKASASLEVLLFEVHFRVSEPLFDAVGANIKVDDATGIGD